jgi:hypothetical protein
MWWWEQIAPVKSSEGFASGTKQESIGYADALPSARRESRTREWGVGGKFEGLERGGTTRAEAHATVAFCTVVISPRKG